MTVKDFSDYTGYKKQTIYIYLRKGKIKANRLTPDRWDIPQEEADLWKEMKSRRK